MRRLMTILLLFLLTLPAASLRAEEGRLRPESRQPSGPQFDSFRLISDRNIFNANRRRGRTDATTETARPVVQDERVYLVGAWIHDVVTSRVAVAFFEGTKSDYNTSRKAGESIAGYRVAEIRTDGVKLEQTGGPIELPVGGGLSRQGEGKWQVVLVSEPPTLSVGRRETDSRLRSSAGPTAASTGASTATVSGGGAADEALKKMMERRRQQTER